MLGFAVNTTTTGAGAGAGATGAGVGICAPLGDLAILSAVDVEGALQVAIGGGVVEDGPVGRGDVARHEAVAAPAADHVREVAQQVAAPRQEGLRVVHRRQVLLRRLPVP